MRPAKKALFTIALLTCLGFSLKAEERYFRFPNPGKDTLSQMTRLISIDDVKSGWVYAYANDKGWRQFQRYGLSVESLKHPGSAIIIQCSHGDVRGWNSYPSHTSYLDMMSKFSTRFPQLCTLENIGKSGKGRNIVAVRLTNSQSPNKRKPQVFYSSTMHGDETTGYVLLLRLIDHLASQYGKDTEEGQRATQLLDNLDLYINPLANPDGTYRNNDKVIRNPIRGNGSGVDLNRNFPDPFGSTHPDGENTQPETKAFIDYGKKHNFVLATNCHGGAEVANYPWDSVAQRHPDDAWWQVVCRRYAESAQSHGHSGYFNDQQNGITNGHDWYEVRGGRQDYMNKILGCREMTLELSSTKLLPASQLGAHWNYNKEALLGYMEEATRGIHGVVVDAKTGNPIPGAKVSLVVTNEIPVTSDQTGAFFRFVLPGTYTLKASAAGYQTQTLADIQVSNGPASQVEIKLEAK